MLQQAKSTSERTVPAYAIPGDFCRIFAENMNSLYLLSYMLTGNPERAEQGFVAALESCLQAPPVFKDWAPSWARRSVIQSAIRIMHPAGERAAWPIDGGPAVPVEFEVPLPSVLRLKTFERFVFVMSVLEGLTDQDCKILLGCSRGDVVRARARALQQISQNPHVDAAIDTRSFPANLAAMSRPA